MKRLIFILQALILFTSVLSADLSLVKFEYLTVDDGLSQGTIEDILQDRQGFMWFATRNGLNRYDGQKFKIYLNDRYDQNSLASNRVWSLGEDTEGNLWIGSTGLNIYDPKLDKMTRVPVDEANENAFHGGIVYDIRTDRDSTLWLSTSKGLVHYFPGKQIFKTYVHDPEKPTSLGSNTVFCTLITRDNKLYVATDTDPVFEFNRKDNSFIEIHYKIAYEGANYWKNMQEDYKGQLYIASEGSAVHVFNPYTGETRLIDMAKGELNSTTVKTEVLMVARDEIWIGTDGGGINVYNPVTGDMQYLLPNDRNSNSLNNKAVFKLFRDKDQNIWVGHFSTGISIWKRNKKKFVSYHHNPVNPQTINKEVVCAIFEDSRGRIWIGQDGGGLSLLHEDDQVFEHFRHERDNPESLTADVILTIREDPDGNLLLGTYSGGLMIFDPDKKKVIKSFGQKDGLPSSHVWNIFVDSKGRYWMSLLRSGVSIYDPSDRSFVYYTPHAEKAAICSDMVMHITEDDMGRIWLGSENEGLCILDVDKGTRINYQHEENNFNSLSNNDVNSVVFIGDYAWIASNGGLNRLDLKTDSFRIFTMEDGLSSNSLMAMLRDKKDNLWISSVHGLMKFNTVNGEVVSYDKSQGIQGTEFKYNAQLQLKDGRMMFGGMNGLTVFYPDSITNSSLRPNVVLTDFRIFNKSVVPGVRGSPIKKHVNFTEYIKLNYKQLMFTIEFASLDYNTPQKNQYKYRLVGFDDEWIEGGNRNFATYTNLDAGRYTFLLKGSNSDGVWNEEAVTLRIIILPPWWKTMFFKIIVVLFILGVSMGFYFYRISVLKKQQSILESLVKKRTSEVEEKNTMLIKQTEELNDINTLMEERQQQIEEQEEQLQANNDHLFQVNDMLLVEQEMVLKQADILAETNRKLEEANQKLTVLNSTKDKFFSIIAHDLKNPFNTVLGFSEILLKNFRGLTEEKKQKFVAAIYDSSHRIFKLLENLLQWAGTQTGNVLHSPEVFNSGEVIDANVELVQEALKEKGIVLTKILPEDTRIFADRNMFDTIVRNLLGNAIKYTEHGTISVVFENNTSYQQISIADSGTGIPEDKMKNIFEIDQTKSAQGTRGETGSGLGLLICREFVQKNGGVITVKSIQGKGTIFSFTVPRMATH